MHAKQLLVRAAAREKILRGATALADAVRMTLGPRSRCVLVERKWGKPLVCNDGVTIARELSLEDPEENMGVQVMREAAEKTGEAVGDGTTTATLLAHAIFSEGLRNVAAGASAIELKRGLDRAVAIAVEAMRRISRPVATPKERMQVATVSAHNDAAIGQLVADAVEKVGPEGVITVEEAKTTETTLDGVEGMQFLETTPHAPESFEGGPIAFVQLRVGLRAQPLEARGVGEHVACPGVVRVIR